MQECRAVINRAKTHPETPMHITLEPVTIDNFETLMEMTLPPEQDQYIASNAFSIAQAHYYPEYRPRAIYCDGQPAGFLLYDVASGDVPGTYGIYRFMVDHKRQGRGIGRRALELRLADLRAQPDAQRITICYKPDNTVARRLYLACGFAEVGIDADGEMIAEIRVLAQAPAAAA
jgi:diamine N-acetyltransferase